MAEKKKKYRIPREQPKKRGRESKEISTRREEIGRKAYEAEKRERLNPFKVVMSRLRKANKKRD